MEQRKPRNDRNNGQRRNGRRNNKRRPRVEKEFEERVVTINRITKVVKGGRKMRFAALVVIGDKRVELDSVLVKLTKYLMQSEKQAKLLKRTLSMFQSNMVQSLMKLRVSSVLDMYS